MNEIIEKLRNKINKKLMETDKKQLTTNINKLLK